MQYPENTRGAAIIVSFAMAALLFWLSFFCDTSGAILCYILTAIFLLLGVPLLISAYMEGDKKK